MTLQISYKTHMGKVRDNNEDSCFANEKLGFFIVADGVGGRNAGEVASRVAVETIAKDLSRAICDNPDCNDSYSDIEVCLMKNCSHKKLNDDEAISILNESISDANDIVYRLAEENVSMHGMGTTVTMALVRDEYAFFAHIGDSRAYSFKNAKVTQITSDHSFVNELLKLGTISEDDVRRHPKKNLITRALGVDPKVQADILKYELEDGEVILLCSDGLSDLVENDEMLKIINTCETLDLAVDSLIAKALSYGGYDNIAVLLFKFQKCEVTLNG